MDGEPAILAVIRAILEDEGHRVTTSAVPLTLEQIAAVDPDLVLMDLLFQGRSAAVPLIEALRRSPAFAELPVILCTAATRVLEPLGDHLAALDVGVLTKPFDLSALLALIGAVAPDCREEAVV